MPTTLPMPRGYAPPAIALHWIMAVLVIGGFALGFYMSDLPASPEKLKYFSWHKWSGITVLGLAVLRTLWRLRHAAPRPVTGMPRWQLRAAQAVHLLLYVLLFAIPLSGWLYSSARGYPVVYFGIKALQLPDLVPKNKELAALLKSVHQTLNWGLLAVVTVHVGAAMKHHLFDRDDTLRRMLPLLRRL